MKRKQVKGKLRTGIFVAISMVMAISSSVYAFDPNKNTDLLLLVNYKHTVSPQYTPKDSVEMAGNVRTSKKSIKLRYTASNAYRQMCSDMKKQGLSLNLISGYRDYNYQTGLYKRQLESVLRAGYKMPYAETKAAESVARPGSSEHQIGLAVDVGQGSSLSGKFGQSPEGKWIAQNCYKYGFVVRYNESKKSITGVMFEPWHLRYVGKPHSNIMYNHSFCFEEYMDYLKANKIVTTTDNNGIKYKIYYTNDLKLEPNNIIDISYNNDGAYILTTLDKDEETVPQTTEAVTQATTEAITEATTVATTEVTSEATTEEVKGEKINIFEKARENKKQSTRTAGVYRE